MSGGENLEDKENASLFVDTDGLTKRRIAGSFTAAEAEKWTFTDTINSGGYDYFGFQKSDGSWQIKRLNDSSMRIANITNNPTMTSYTLAWASYDSLTYNKVEDI